MDLQSSMRATVRERLTTALLAALLAAVTLFAYLIFAAIFVVRGAPMSDIFGAAFSWWAVAIIAVAAIIGFALGSERIAEVFSFFWGTHEVWREAWLRRLVFALLAVVLLVLLVHGVMQSQHAA
jgi:hypothetical protein